MSRLSTEPLLEEKVQIALPEKNWTVNSKRKHIVVNTDTKAKLKFED